MIMRLFTAGLIGLAIVTGIESGVAVAQEKKAAQSKAPAAGLRDCKTKGAGGKMLTWKCRTEQPCCYNATTNQGVCGSPVIGCF